MPRSADLGGDGRGARQRVTADCESGELRAHGSKVIRTALRRSFELSSTRRSGVRPRASLSGRLGGGRGRGLGFADAGVDVVDVGGRGLGCLRE